jgi:prevent-host-death family protein
VTAVGRPGVEGGLDRAMLVHVGFSTTWSAKDMSARVSAAEANRNFSALLRRVQQGERITITSRGRPVAEIAPPRPPLETADEREAAVRAVLAQHSPPEITWIGPWNREELYEDDGG